MSDLPERRSDPDQVGADLDLAERPALPERRRRHGLVLTAEEKVARRHNRRWMLGIAIPSIAVLLIALISSGKAEKNEPNGPSIAAPAGYKVHRDGYFSYVVPAKWSNNPIFSDSTGDLDTSGASGWVAEHIGYRAGPPVLGEPRPGSLRAFGMPRPEAYQLTGGHPVTVKGATAAFTYSMTRPGFAATVLDVWSNRSGVEIWLVVDAPPAITSQILSSLSA